MDEILRPSHLGYKLQNGALIIAPPEKLAQAAQQVTAPNKMRRLIKVAYADYPSEALEKQISGTVKATIVVDAAGDVTMADVTSGPVELRASAFKSFMGLKYSPATETVRINVGLEYRLDPQGWGVRVVQQDASLAMAEAATTFRLQALREATAQQNSAAPGAPVRVGGEIAPPKKIKDQAPVYPPVARNARVQGVVILEATIDAAGNVMDAKVLRSIPLLDQAAIDAVMQWQYTPTLLNGVAVPVIMTVTVNFTLAADPTVALKITLPNGATPGLAIRDDGGLGTVSLPDVGTFGFTPIKGVSATARTIAIYQITEPGSPLKPLGSVQVELNGGVVQSSTTPSFGIELVRLP
jgi:TonB family protein